jgi:hypothetical protein
MRKEKTMTQKDKSQTNARPIAPKSGVKAPAKATRLASARRLAVNHNETLLRVAVTPER